ncbi:2596_t:CDS:2 [Diversispora eburnea]|uniref:2596_t:CDS:1 n=1 Tax=Diversispora eburnea TaxID=1213867 RepID=A0A9N8ZF72_9GLOM|nr:2596_t:CDS:2 [Diversispora eburnea]
MSRKLHSSFLNENEEVSSFFGNRTAISPDSQQIVTFSLECEIYRTPTIMTVLDLKWPADLMLIVVFAFGYAMFILLNHADDLQIPTYKIKDISNSDFYSNITIYQNVDKSSRLDNFYQHFISSKEAVFFWTNGRWDQKTNGIVTLDEFDGANKKSFKETLRSRAKIIAKYEALEHFFDRKSDNLRYIYYIPNPDKIVAWLTETENDEKQKSRLMKTTDPDHIKIKSLDKISFIDEEIFSFEVVTTKMNKKSQRSKLLKNFGYNNSCNEPSSEGDQLSMRVRFNSLNKI